MAGILDAPRRQVDGEFRLVIECDEPFHEGPRILAGLTRDVRHIKGGLSASWRYSRPEIGGVDGWGEGFYPADVKPDAARLMSLVDGEVITETDFLNRVRDRCSLEREAELRELVRSGEASGYDRLKVRCPTCQSFDVVLNIKRVPGGSDWLFECPILDKISAAGMKRVSLRLLAHAVSYGVS